MRCRICDKLLTFKETKPDEDGKMLPCTHCLDAIYGEPEEETEDLLIDPDFDDEDLEWVMTMDKDD